MLANNEILDLPGLTQNLSDDGFIIVDDLFDATMAASLLIIAESATTEIRNTLGDREIGIGSAAGYDEIVQRSPGRWDVPVSLEDFGVDRKSLPWMPLIEGVLGADVRDTYSGVVSSEPGSPAQFWHTDSPHLQLQHGPAHALNVLVALHDIPLDMGPTEFARGSHRLTNHLQNQSLVVEELIYQHEATSPQTLVAGVGIPAPESWARPLAVGSCLIFDDRLLHRGLANHSAGIRYVAYFSYCVHGYSENTHFEAQRSVFQ